MLDINLDKGKNKNYIYENRVVNVGSAYRVKYEYQGAYWKVRNFTGLCVGVSYKGAKSRVILVNIINGTRVEFSFFLFGKHILKVEQLSVKKFKKLRKSKLFFLRRKKLSLSRI